jgi:predicted GH43/DUF377 family glycosyl hydrolase
MNIRIQRSDVNPILIPDINNFWEAEATFNGCPVTGNGIIHFLYRAMSLPQQYDGLTIELSTIGYASSKDGVYFEDRRQFIYPEYAWEHYGCEDPRVTKIGGKYFIFYTALSMYPFSSEGIKIGVAITRDFKSIDEKHLVTPFNAKAMALFPSKIGGKYLAILTVNTDKPPAKIAIASFNHIQQIWSPEYWARWYSNLDRHVLHIPQTNNDHIEVGAPPVRTKFGWLLIYSHISNYFLPPATFGIRALLLDLERPHRIIARTDQPLLIPEASYECFGKVPNIVFPSGAIKNRQKLHIYYGAADTTCALASTNLLSIINNMTSSNVTHRKMDRYPGNPIISPKQEHTWEAKAVFNPAALYESGKVHIIYRAMSEDNTSVMGYAVSSDGFTIDERLDEPIYVPREEFESKGIPGGNSGCEDPRLTLLEGTIYMLYTAYRGDKEPRVALTSIAKDDFLNRRWKWSKPRIISPPGLADKDAALFPVKINGQFTILHRLGTNIWLDFRDDLNFDENRWLGGKEILTPEDDIKGTFKVGIAGPPIKTDYGWLLLYHGVTNARVVQYHLTAAILDLYEPTRVLAISDTPILEPEMPYEKEGNVPNVVFPCGNIIKDDRLIVYYGAADRVIGIASMELTDLLNQLNN